MADASYFPYQTGVPVKLINLGPDAPNATDKYAFAMALSASGAAQGVYEVAVQPGVGGVPALSKTSYAAGLVIGGILTFEDILSPNYGYGGILESISVKFTQTLQTAALNVAIFTQPPTGTFTDNSVAAINPADSAFLLGVYQLTISNSTMGTHTIYNLDGIAKALVGSSVTSPPYAGNLYVVVVPSGNIVATLADTGMIVSLGILGG